MAAPILPSLFPRPPLPPHRPFYFPPAESSAAIWGLPPPPPVQFYPHNNASQFLQPPPPQIVGAANVFIPRPGPSGPGFRGRGEYHYQRGGRGRGRGGAKRGHQQNQSVEKKCQRPAEFSCKVCNKEYRSEESYQIHIQSHRKCTSCDFEAVPRVLKEHELLHFLPDELRLTSPEDVKKWREDRRKNYPTAENIAKKKKSDEEKKARGEVAKTPLYKYIKRILGDDGNERMFGRRGKWARRGGRGRGQHGGGRGHRQGGPWRSSRRGRGGGRKYTGRGERSADDLKERQTDSNPADACTSSESQSESLGDNSEAKSLAECESEKNDTKNGLMNTILENNTSVASYSPVAVATKQSLDQSETANNEKMKGTSHEVASDSIPSTSVEVVGDDEKTKKQPRSCGGRAAGRKRKMEEERHSKRDIKRRRKKISMGLNSVHLREPTLLEKLLGPEIRREQNAILQCIHHVIDQDFFGLNSSQPSSS